MTGTAKSARRFWAKPDQLLTSVLFTSLSLSKLAQKGFARLTFSNFKDGHDLSSDMEAANLEPFKAVNLSETFNGDFTTAIMKASQPLMMKKLDCNLDFTRRLGNMYTPSLYLQLVNFVSNHPNDEDVNQKKVCYFHMGVAALL
uniref:Hydroxymethylglutaryl-coenzyme A synthase C-terminal domain-containing protein n=1 Tax=Ditylenchus dipsaci TaxID=166011 RepID=A0A915D3E0_9BILA